MPVNRNRQTSHAADRARPARPNPAMPARFRKNHHAEDEKPAGSKSWNTYRPGKVVKARQLIKDAEYPPVRVLTGVARVLAKHWKKVGARPEA